MLSSQYLLTGIILACIRLPGNLSLKPRRIIKELKYLNSDLNVLPPHLIGNRGRPEQEYGQGLAALPYKEADAMAEVVQGQHVVNDSQDIWNIFEA